MAGGGMAGGGVGGGSAGGSGGGGTFAPYLVKDVGTITVDPQQFSTWANPGGFTQLNGLVLFVMEDEGDGAELWRTDGTPAGTFLLRDIFPGPNANVTAPLTRLNGVLLFAADDGSHGTELWRTDGTPAGTDLVADLFPGPWDSNPSRPVVLGSAAYFFADDGIHGPELWKTDGTAAGTAMVTDIRPGDGGAGAAGLTAIGGRLYFQANDGAHGAELWTSDGTPSGTTLVADLAPGSAGSFPAEMTPVDGGFVFTASSKLWVSLGAAPSVLPGPAPDGGPFGFTAFSGAAYFEASDGIHGLELWKTDGTPAGTAMLADLNPGPGSSSPTTTLYGYTQYAVAAAKLFFLGVDATGVTSVWATDGTPAGTVLLGAPTPASSSIEAMTAAGNLVYFSGGATRQMWRSDGTPSGTFPVVNTFLIEALPFDGGLIMNARDNVTLKDGLFWTDGTDAGTFSLADSLPAQTSANPMQITDIHGHACFIANEQSGSLADEVWCSDGTATGTTIVMHANDFGWLIPLQTDSMLAWFPSDLWRVDDYGAAISHIFSSFDGNGQHLQPLVSGGFFYFNNRDSLWRSDGTDAGTTPVVTFPAGSNQPWSTNLIDFNGGAIFRANDGIHGDEPWTTEPDGGASMITDLNPGPGGSGPYSLTHFAGGIAFIGNFTAIYKTDGTASGTTVLGSSNARFLDSLTAAGSSLFFVAEDDAHGRELWVTDGTSAGLVKDIWPGPTGSEPQWLVSSQGRVYFAANDPAHGFELWTSDGTPAGTQLVTDLTPGPSGSKPYSLTVLPDQSIAFAGSNGPSGNELWILPAGSNVPRLTGDIRPGAASSNPMMMAVSGNRLYFNCDDGVHGSEVWALQLGP
jgi:ELWxxDGT repeat protein